MPYDVGTGRLPRAVAAAGISLESAIGHQRGHELRGSLLYRRQRGEGSLEPFGAVQRVPAPANRR